MSLAVGTDQAADPATHGYCLNHSALIVHDIDAMRHFYGEILGMRHIMTYQLSQTYQVVYMGYPANGADFQTGEQLFKELRRRDGLLEFLCSSVDRKAPAKPGVGGFSHVGIVVPDVKAAEERLVRAEVPILKGLGDATLNPGSVVSEWWGLSETLPDAVVQIMGWSNVLLVADPEGNVVELLQRE